MIAITPTTANALDESIEKWKECAEGKRVAMGTEDCALCEIFFWSWRCDQCPIALDTGNYGCDGTPYRLYAEYQDVWFGDHPDSDEFDKFNLRAAEAFKELATEEYLYLLGLKDRCEVID